MRIFGSTPEDMAYTLFVLESEGINPYEEECEDFNEDKSFNRFDAIDEDYDEE